LERGTSLEIGARQEGAAYEYLAWLEGDRDLGLRRRGLDPVHLGRWAGGGHGAGYRLRRRESRVVRYEQQTEWLSLFGLKCTGFGNANNRWPYWDNSVAVYNGNLYVGTGNWTDGGEVWLYLYRVYLPLTLRNH